MRAGRGTTELIKYGVKSKIWNLPVCNAIASVRNCSNLSKIDNKNETSLDQKKEIAAKKDYAMFEKTNDSYVPVTHYWNEYSAVRRAIKRNSPLKKVDNMVNLFKTIHSLKLLPRNFPELIHFLKHRHLRKEIFKQQYLPERVSILRPDLAAATFIACRGGSVKFVGQNDWLDISEIGRRIPATYVPGLYIKAINAEGTNLIGEGLENLAQLRYLSHLSLKGSKNLNDWCMDWISNQFSSQLTHLDLSDCTGITHRGLSCFYRFEILQTLNVSGVPDTPEFKVACLMLLDIMPNLEIVGINLDVPQKLESLDKHEMNLPPEREKEAVAK